MDYCFGLPRKGHYFSNKLSIIITLTNVSVAPKCSKMVAIAHD